MLTDTNILIRSLQPQHPHYALADRAVRLLSDRGEKLHIVPQNLFELWVVATRPLGQNGLGLSASQAGFELRRIKRLFKLLRDTPQIYDAWEDLVTRYSIAGKPAHDTRLVAAMQIHGLTSILTFDKTGFSRFPGIEVIDPADL